MWEEGLENQAQWLHPYKWTHFLLNTNAHNKSTGKKQLFFLLIILFYDFMYYIPFYAKKKKSLCYTITWREDDTSDCMVPGHLRESNGNILCSGWETFCGRYLITLAFLPLGIL